MTIRPVPPWRLIPAHIVLHIAVFLGTLHTVLFGSQDDTGTPAVIGPISGVAPWAYLCWLVLGLSSAPIIAASYATSYYGGGRARYLALWLHLIGNLNATIVLVGYLVAAVSHGVVLAGWAFAWFLYGGALIMAGWLFVNDISRLSQLEALAERLFKADNDAQ